MSTKIGRTCPDGAAASFAAWSARLNGLTTEQAALAADAFVDTLGCMVAGADDPSTEAVVRVVASSPGDASCVDGGMRSPAAAAAVNATAAHAIDFDDNFTPGMSHASAVIVPALLAVVESEPGLAGRLLPSYAVGLQAQAYVGSLVGYGHYVAGWHGTSTVGCIGAAAAVAHLVSEEPDLVRRSMTVAASYASGVKAQFGTAMKAVHAGLAARNAVEAVQLATEGVAGDPAVLERNDGFAGLYGAGGRPGEAGRWLGTGLAIEDPGVLPKRYPSCGSTHLVLDGLEDLREDHRFELADVAAVDAVIGAANLGSLPFRRPLDGRSARFSMDYCVEVYLRNGRLRLDDFTDARVGEYLAARRPFALTLSAWEPPGRHAGDEPAHPPHQVRVTLKDGTTLTRTRELPRGSIVQPLTAGERRAKFLDCCGTGAGRLFDRLQALRTEPDLAAVKEVFAVAAALRSRPGDVTASRP